MSMYEVCIFCGMENPNKWQEAFQAGWRRLVNGTTEVISCPQHTGMLAIKM